MDSEFIPFGGTSASVGSGLGTGISQSIQRGLNLLAEQKMQKMQQRQLSNQFQPLLKNKGISDFLAALSPEERKNAWANLGPLMQLSQFDNASGGSGMQSLGGLGGAGQPDQGQAPGERPIEGQESDIGEDSEGRAASNSNANAIQQKRAMLLAEAFKSPQQRMQEELLALKREKAGREREKDKDISRKIAEPFIEELRVEAKRDKAVKQKAERALSLFNKIKNKLPGVIGGNLPAGATSLLIRDPEVRDYMNIISELPTLIGQTRKGVLSKYRIEEEKKSKVDINQPMETQRSVLERLIKDYGVGPAAKDYAFSLRNKHGNYPRDLKERVDEYIESQSNPLKYPQLFEEGTSINYNGKTYVLRDGDWEEGE